MHGYKYGAKRAVDESLMSGFRFLYNTVNVLVRSYVSVHSETLPLQENRLLTHLEVLKTCCTSVRDVFCCIWTYLTESTKHLAGT